MACLQIDCARPRADVGPEADSREIVMLLHGSAAAGGMWRRITGLLPPQFRSVTPDLLGYGRSAGRPLPTPFTLADERRALEPLLSCGAGQIHLVGYSYGGAVALDLAINYPAQVRKLTLIEPVFFTALRYGNEPAAYAEFRGVRDRFVDGIGRGDRESALQQFIDFWTGPRAWAALPDRARADMLMLCDKIVLDWDASFAADPGVDALAELGPRTTLLRGDESPDPMRRLIDALHRLMTGSRRIEVPGANHLLPLTHPAAIAAAVIG